MSRPLLRRPACLATALLLHAAAAEAQVIVGRVVDDASGGGVPQVRVTAAGPGTRRTLTGDDGHFTLALRGGRYTVRVARTGYENLSSAPVTVGAGDTVRVTLRMHPAARRLSGITATARRRRPPIVGVYYPVVPTRELLASPITAQGAHGYVVVRGQMATPTPCYRLVGAAERTASFLTLTVHARPSGEQCLAAPGDSVPIGASTYKVTMRRLPAGTYTLRVLHAYHDDVWRPSVVVDTTIAVN